MESSPSPPDNLSFGNVQLRFVEVKPGDPARRLVPFYHFRILHADDTDVGHINFKIGETDHVRLYVGHIGFEIIQSFRGQGFARRACQALAPFVRSIYPEVILTCDPDNGASKKTIENLGATFIEKVEIPPQDPAYQSGARWKLRYRWKP